MHWLYDVLDDGAWSGQRCFIIGGGPSLVGFNFERLRGELVIGTNRAFERFDSALLFSIDRRFFQWVEGGALGAQVLGKWRDYVTTKVWLSVGRGPEPSGPDVYSVAGGRGNGISFSMRNGLRNVSNSGYGAVNLACCLGCPEIYLLGFDMAGNATTGQQTWWHDGYPQVQKNNVYQRHMIPAFDRNANAMQQHGHHIVNLNPDSALRCFPFSSMDEVMQHPTPRRPLVVSFCTEGTGYCEEAERMGHSVHRFGFSMDIRRVPTRGGWNANTYYKAEFLLQMMEEHRGINLLWLDVDAEMKRYPVAFDNLDMDIALTVVDWMKYKRPSLGTELLSGTIYLRNNERVRDLVRYWIQLNNESQQNKVLEQRNLHKALQRFDGSICFLPDSYCQIFDLMRDNGLPIIQQNQASRRLRREVGR